MEYAETVAHLGQQHLRKTATSPQQSSQGSKERFKAVLQTYVAAAPGLRKRIQAQLKPKTSSSQQGTTRQDAETPTESLLRLGRTMIARKEVFTKEEAALFIRGDVQLGRMGLVQLCGVEDRALGSAALVLLDELLLDDDIDHPSRDAFTEAFVNLGYTSLSRELCLDRHILNDDTRHSAFRVALAVGAGHNEDLPLLFRNHRAALDLYLKWMKDMNEDEADDDDDSSINTGSAIDADEERGSSLKMNASFQKDDLGPKTWDEVAQSVEDDDDFGEFDSIPGNRLKNLINFRDSSSTLSVDGEIDHQQHSWTTTDKLLEDTDPLKIRIKSGASTLKTFPKQAITNPEALLEKLYGDASRIDLSKGLTYLNRELMSKETVQQKLVHDRLVDLVRVRQTVDTLGSSVQQGRSLSGKAAQSLRAAKAVSDMSLASVLVREDQSNQIKRALEIITERPTNKFLLTFAPSLERLSLEGKLMEGAALLKRYIDERGEMRLPSTASTNQGSTGGHPAALPALFKRARSMNDGAVVKFVKVVEEALATKPSVDTIRVFVDVHELVPEMFRQVTTNKSAHIAGVNGDRGEDSFVRDTDLVLTSIASEKAEKVCSALSGRYEQVALDLSEKAGRAKAALFDLSTGVRPDLEPDAVPPNLHGRAKAARTACEKYAAIALSTSKQLTKLAMDFLQWTEPFEVFGIDLERARGLVVERCVEHISAMLMDNAPPGIPGETAVLLAVAQIGESMWSSSVMASVTVLSGSRTTASASDSSSQSGSQTSSQYKSFVHQSSQGMLAINAPGVLDFFAELNGFATSVHSGFGQLARRCTESTLDYVLDEMVATLDCLSRNLNLIAVDKMISEIENVVGDADQEDTKKEFCVSLMQSTWETIEEKHESIVKPLLASCASRAQSLMDTLQTNERLTKAARYAGTILGRCAEQYRLRGNDPTGKGFLLLARDCQILRSCVINQLVSCDTTDIQAQFDRLEPALATQYLRASSQHFSDRLMDLLTGAKDPLTGVRFPLSSSSSTIESLGEESEVIVVSERWVAILHSVAEAVSECEGFLGWRYAAKLKGGLARHVGGRIQAFTEAELAHLDQARAISLMISVTFVSRVLKATGEEFGFSKAATQLKSKARMDPDVAEAKVDDALSKWSWLVECFARL